MKWLPLTVLLLALGCTPQQRMARLVKRHPELLRKDTLVVRDTIRLKEDRADTVFSHATDTVVLDRGRLEVRYVERGGVKYLSGKCRDSVIVREMQVPVEKVVVKPPPESWVARNWAWLPWVILIAGMVVGMILGQRRSK